MEEDVSNQGGHLMLLESMLSSSPTYLSLFTIPSIVANWNERIQCNFLRGEMDGKVKFHLVSWNKVCHLISYGGLGGSKGSRC